MNKCLFKIRIAAAGLFLLLFSALFTSPLVFAAATHQIQLTAEQLPNGQYGYKMVQHEVATPVGTQDLTAHYPNRAVIPGPSLLVKQGDTVNVELTNETEIKVGFNAPGLTNGNTKVDPGQTENYSFNADQTGTYLYQDEDQVLVGLFGAIVVDPIDGMVESYIDGADGAIIPVSKDELSKQYVLFMVGSTFWGTEIASNGNQTPLWTNPTLGAVLNDIVRFHVLSVGPAHTFHLHAHRWLNPGTTNVIDTKLMAEPSDTHTFTVKAGDGVGPGDWQYHCHVFAHMEAGMHANFKVVTPSESGASIAGASPYGGIFDSDGDGPGLATFEISDEPGRWFRSTRGDITGVDTQSLELLLPGDSIHFVMSDTNAVHTMTSLLWPSGAERMPFDQIKAYKGGGTVQLSKPGLYVFTCKVHPYMFGAVIVDDPETDELDLGKNITLATGVEVPTMSDLAIRLLRTFFVATAPNNWQDYTSDSPWEVKYPDVDVRISGITGEDTVVNLSNALQTSIDLAELENPATPGVGEVWVDTQFEKTANKDKPGTITVFDAATWEITRKISLPEINMNHPHNLWTNQNQSLIYQTQWFDNKLAVLDRETGELLHNIRVGEAPAHVMTRSDNDAILVTLNGEEGISEILAGENEVNRIIPTQEFGQDPTNPHGHWISADGSKVVTPNIFTGDAGVYNTDTGAILSRTPTGTPGAHPIAIGMMPDSSKYYVANLLDHTLSVIDTDTGERLKNINLIADYNPITGELSDGDGNGKIALGVLPIQTPVSPDGEAVVTANTGGTITIVDTETDTLAAMLPCDPGCHGVQFGAKQGGGYYAYVSSKFSNELIVVDIDPNQDGDVSDAEIAGRLSLVGDNTVPTDDPISGLAGYGGQGILPIPNVYNGWVQNLPQEWQELLTEEQRNPAL